MLCQVRLLHPNDLVASLSWLIAPHSAVPFVACWITQNLDVSIAWHKCICGALRVPYRTHVSLLPAVSASALHLCRLSGVLRFAYRCVTSENPTVGCLTRHCLRSNLRVLGSGVLLILRDLNGSVVRSPSFYSILKLI